MMSETTVVNCRTREPYDIYIGRPSKWGNPFVIGRDGSREEVLRKFRSYAIRRFTTEDFLELLGQRLGCFCHPLPCHGDVLAELAIKAHNETGFSDG